MDADKDKIEYLTNQNEFLKNKLRESVDKNKILEEEYDKLLEENHFKNQQAIIV